MQQFSFEKTEYDNLIIINPFISNDCRGSFIKYFEKNIFKENKIDIDTFDEAFESVSKKGVIRGLHFQTGNPQAKLIRVSYGEILDVVVDLRKESDTFGKWYSINISDENKRVLYVPKGFAHGFITLSEIAIVSYSCNCKYSKETDSGIVWNDKDLNIDWQLNKVDGVIVSDKDKKLQSYKEFCKNNKF